MVMKKPQGEAGNGCIMTWKVLGTFFWPNGILKYLYFPNLHEKVVRSLELSAIGT